MGFLQVRKKEHSYGKEICYECDTCGKPFIRNYKKRLTISKTGFFCSNKCSNENRMKLGILQQNLFSKENRKKAKEAKARKTPEEMKEISEKAKRTSRERYGVDNISQLPEIKKKKEQTVLKNYGVKHQWSSPKIREQIHQKMKENGSYNHISKPQKRFHKVLIEYFGKQNVEHSLMVNGWEIDFYIKSMDTYVQFDGIYWHGLDRPLNEIRKIKSQRDKAILKTVERDYLQNCWFKDNNLKLIRITDKQFNLHKKGIVEYL
jgi:hypothetical protein